MQSRSDRDSITALADVLLGYLGELDTYRKICRNHEGTVTLEDRGGGLQVCRTFPCREEGITCLRSSVNAQRGWEQTPFWQPERGRWENLRMKREADLKAQMDMQPLITKGISWEGRAVLISAFSSDADAVLHVDIQVPPVPTDLPELPLRLMADILRCHEYLLPASTLLPLPIPAKSGNAPVTIAVYLQRTTPQNLCASQCFSLPGAEQCPTVPLL